MLSRRRMKSISRRFPVQVGLAFCGVAAVAAYPLALWGSAAILTAALVGAVLSTSNVLIGFAMIEYGFDKSYTTFLKVVVGGMGLRMALMLGALMVLIMVFHLHTVALTGTAVLFMMIYLVLEVFYLQKKLDVKNQG
jgi:hypothetical protein